MWPRSGFLDNSISRTISFAKRFFARGEQCRQLQRLDREELEKIARDIGVSVFELFKLASERDDIQELLKRRLAETGLSEEILRECYPKALGDLNRVCASCAVSAQCSDDFQHGRQGRSEYCPNTAAIDALRKSNDLNKMAVRTSTSHPPVV